MDKVQSAFLPRRRKNEEDLIHMSNVITTKKSHAEEQNTHEEEITSSCSKENTLHLLCEILEAIAHRRQMLVTIMSLL